MAATKRSNVKGGKRNVKTNRVDEYVVAEMDKLEAGLAKLATATSELVLGVASQKQRQDYIEESHQKLEDAKVVEHTRIHERINAVQSDLAQKHNYLNDRIASVQQELTERIAEQAAKQTEKLTAHLDSSLGNLSNEIKSHVAELKTEHNTLAKRVTTLEVWRWIIVGGGIVVGFIVSAILVKVLTAAVEAFGGWSAILLK